LLLFKIPKDIHLQELRTYPRRTFELSDKTTIATVFINKFDNLPIQTVCPVINISLGGICITVSTDTMKKINIDQEVILQPISSFPELRYPTRATIRNIRKFSKKTFIKDEVFAIGLAFILHEDA
jgi:hypothetical protein